MGCPIEQIQNKDTPAFPYETNSNKGLTKREHVLIELTKAYISAGYGDESVNMSKKTTELLLKEF